MSRRLRVAMLLLTATALGGCSSVPAGRFQAFSSADAAILDQMGGTTDRIQRKLRQFVVLTAPDEALAPDSFEPVVNGKKFDINDQLQARIAVLNVIVNYAHALELLTGSNYADAVDKASQELAASLKGVKGLNGDASNAFSTVVDGLAKGATGYMRKRALKDVMANGQRGLDVICIQLQQDIQKTRPYVNLMRDRYIARANAARPKYATADRYPFDLQVANELDEYRQIDRALVAMSQAIQGIPDAHRQMLLSLDDSAKPLDALHNVISNAQNLRNFYRGLSN